MDEVLVVSARSIRERNAIARLKFFTETPHNNEISESNLKPSIGSGQSVNGTAKKTLLSLFQEDDHFYSSIPTTPIALRAKSIRLLDTMNDTILKPVSYVNVKDTVIDIKQEKRLVDRLLVFLSCTKTPNINKLGLHILQAYPNRFQWHAGDHGTFSYKNHKWTFIVKSNKCLTMTSSESQKSMLTLIYNGTEHKINEKSTNWL